MRVNCDNIPIGGLLPVSFLDWEGKVTSVVFLQGCNFRCPYCHNRDLVLRFTETLDPKQVIKEIKQKKNFLDGVVISGGEPTLSLELPFFIRQLKGEIKLPVKLDTNGSNPNMLAMLINEGLISAVAMDIKGPWDKYSDITRSKVDINKILESLRLIKQSGIEYVLRTTYVPQLMSLEDLRKIQEQISYDSAWRIQLFRPNSTLDESFSDYDSPSPESIKDFFPDVPIVGIDL